MPVPAESQRDVQHVHAQVVHHPGVTAEPALALPADRLVRVQVAGVAELVAGLDQRAERTVGNHPDRLLGAGVERQLAGTADEHVRAGLQRGDAPAAEIDPERLLGQDVLARRDGVQVELLVQVVPDGDVDHVEPVVGEQVAMVADLRGHGVDGVEPGQRGLVDVADAGQHRPDRVVHQRRPAGQRGRHLAAHQPTADDPTRPAGRHSRAQGPALGAPARRAPAPRRRPGGTPAARG